MRGERVPDKDHISRYCSPKTIRDDGKIGRSAFILRESENYLSVNWLEYLDCTDRDSEIDEIRRVLSLKLNIGAKAKIAVLNVGEVCNKVESKFKRVIEVLHEPEAIDTSHSGIYHMRPDNEFIASLILETQPETYPAR